MDVPKPLDCTLVDEQDLVSRYIGRKLSPEEAETFEEHYFGCERCWGEVKTGAEIAAVSDAAVNRATRSTARRGPRRLPVLLAAAAGVAFVAAGAILVLRSARSSDVEPRSALAVLVGDQRPIEPRLAGLEWKPYSAQRGVPSGLEGSSSAVLEATARIKRAEETNPSPQNVGVVGAANLLLGKPDTAVARLENATSRAPKDASLQNDLAAAYLVLGSRAQESGALFKALSAAERAIELDRSLMEAYFNRALILESLSMTPRARQAWTEYLARDPTSGWSNEARRHLASLRKTDNAAAWPSERDRLLRAADSQAFALVEEIVGRYPQSTREYVEQEVLPAWGDAYLAGDREKSTRLLRALAIIAAAHLRTSSDRMLPDVVQEIESAFSRPSNRDALEAHARGLVGFRKAKEAYDRFDSRAATQLFRESRRDLELAHNHLAAWAALYEGIGLYFATELEAAETAFDQLRVYAEARSYLNLAGRAQWLIGLIRTGRSDLGNALHPYFRALSCFERSRESGNVGAVHSLIATAYDNLGENETAWVHRRKALAALASLGDRRRDYSIFSDVAIAAIAQDLAHSALEFQQAALRAANGWASPAILAEAHLYNALILDRLGLHAQMRSSMEAARRQLSAIRDEDIATAVREQVNATEGEILVKDDPAAAERKLSDALNSFLKPDSKRGRQVTLRLPELYLARGRAFLAQGNGDGAEADFRAGIEEFEFFRARQKSYGVSYFSRSWDLFGEMIRLQSVSRGRPDRALGFVERSRARDLLDGISSASRSGVRGGAGARTPIEPQLLSRGLPDGVALIYYAVLEDRLLAWVVTRTRITFSQRLTSARALTLRVAALRQAMQTASPKSFFDAEASALFEDLIRPLNHALPSGSTLVFLPDGVLNEVPFAALRDTRSGRYLVEQHPLGLTPSGTVFGGSGGHPGEEKAEQPSALVVGNPRFDSEEFPSLERLPESEVEARTVAGLYSDSELLTGEAATRTRFLESASHRTVVHFAGHAIANAEFPLLSRLVLAPDLGAPTAGSGALFARELYSTRFPVTRLVVLAGCHTSSGVVVKGEGVMSLARPFLAAGVPAVVATLWDLEDRAGNEIFSVFHRRFREGDEPMEALRRAQLALISSGDPVLQSPKAWAGLQVFVANRNPS